MAMKVFHTLFRTKPKYLDNISSMVQAQLLTYGVWETSYRPEVVDGAGRGAQGVVRICKVNTRVLVRIYGLSVR